MKTLFKIHPLTYLVLISVLFSGYFNYFLIISTILIIHDLGHILFIKLFGFKISNIEILPFGSIINSDVNLNSPTGKVFVISIIGILMQLLLYPIFYYLSLYYINNISYNIFLNYNKMILLFNLLPVIPLDGSKILMCFLESRFNYKLSLKLLNIISIIVIILFTLYLSYTGLNSYLIISFLLYKTFEEIKNHKYLFNQFLLTRYLTDKRYFRVKYVNSLKQIFKNKHNFIENESEDKILKKQFNP